MTQSATKMPICGPKLALFLASLMGLQACGQSEPLGTRSLGSSTATSKDKKTDASAADEEVATVEIAVIVAGRVESPGQVGDVLKQLIERRVARAIQARRLRFEAPSQKVIELLVTREFLGDYERFDDAVRRGPLAIGDGSQRRETISRQGESVFRLATAGAPFERSAQ